MRKNRKDILGIIILFLAFYASLELLDGLFYDILGIAFLIGALYGVVVLHKRKKFI